MWLDAEKSDTRFEMRKWEEEWIQLEYKNETKPFENPLEEMVLSLKGRCIYLILESIKPQETEKVFSNEIYFRLLWRLNNPN